MELNDTIIAKMQKLYNMWQKNTEGAENEAITAKKMLDEYLKKYNISLEDIFEKQEEITEYKIEYSSKDEKIILIQCICYLFGSLSDEWKNSYRYRNGKMELCIKTTKINYILLKDLFDFHKENYKLQLEKMKYNFFRAYLQEHQLFDKDEDKNPIQKKGKISELYDIFTILGFKKQMENSNHYSKKIENTFVALNC